MTGVDAAALARPRTATRRRPGLAPARLLWLELRHNAMLWMLPVAIALFWFSAYRRAMALPPFWSVRAATMQLGAVVAFVTPVVGAAAWMGSREARRHTSDLVTVTARPRWARLLATWAATTCWAVAGYLACVAVTYVVTAQHAHWGGPLWWPAAVAGVSLPAMSAVGFAAGVLVPSRFTAPAAAVAAFFVLVLSTELIVGSQSYWQISPLVTGPWDTGSDAGVGTFYPYLPDLAIAQVMFLAGITLAVLAILAVPRGSGGRWLRAAAAGVGAAGLVAAGTAVVLAGTGRLDAHGMITIPALHDAASDRPLSYRAVCSQTAIPVCLNPAYASYLPGTASALQPLLSEIAGLPGAPARISQAAATYHQGRGNDIGIGASGPSVSGTPLTYHLLLPDQLLGPPMTASELAAQVASIAGPAIVASVVGDGQGASQAQHAVDAALMWAVRLPVQVGSPGAGPPGRAGGRVPQPEVAPGSAAYAAARRFAGLPASARHAWLMQHLTALRAGLITLAQLP